ncbi:hypothetical protein [Devosia sp. RR2S18]|uniref:hypothetical protein n=1 Tax=Devosia rhizosphaerae TaxID=3049774 RepID=UPI0025401954|nr:hypothetical protein [Devosia sp. RR2S18]WIJ26966.1 hypothetical protein QOV41_09555 [Devosia sp. RR2S18]
MSFLLSGPIRFFDEDQLTDLVEEFSHRVRRDPLLRPALDQLVGNRWADAEASFLTVLRSSLLSECGIPTDGNLLAKAARLLRPADVERLATILMNCAMEIFPIESAADFIEVGDELAGALMALVNSEGQARQRQVLRVRDQLSSGALLAGL